MTTKQVKGLTVKKLGTTKAYIMDLNGLNKEEGIELLQEFWSIFKNDTEPFCTIFDVTHFTVGRDFTKLAKKVADYAKEQKLTRGSAFVGIGGIKKVLAKAIRPGAQWLDTMDDAIKWAESLK